jgi:hypothetical protein
MKTTLALTAVTALMLAAIACEKKEDAKPAAANVTSAVVTAKASCNMRGALGTCNEYRGSSLGVEKSLCEGFKGQFSNGPCPVDDLIARCELSDGEVKRYYGPASAGESAMSREEAQADCESDIVKGKFSTEAVALAK